MILIDHDSKLVQLLLGERVEESLLIVLSLGRVSSDVGRSSLHNDKNGEVSSFLCSTTEERRN